jgi:hypothetical protein
MTDSQKQSASKSPSHVAYHIRNREGADGIWTRIGSAWAHADGSGFNVQLDAMPLDGRITLRIASDKSN